MVNGLGRGPEYAKFKQLIAVAKYREALKTGKPLLEENTDESIEDGVKDFNFIESFGDMLEEFLLICKRLVKFEPTMVFNFLNDTFLISLEAYKGNLTPGNIKELYGNLRKDGEEVFGGDSRTGLRLLSIALEDYQAGESIKRNRGREFSDSELMGGLSAKGVSAYNLYVAASYELEELYEEKKKIAEVAPSGSTEVIDMRIEGLVRKQEAYFELAIDSYEEARVIAENGCDLDDARLVNMINIYSNFASLYAATGNVNKALEYYKKALDFDDKLDVLDDDGKKTIPLDKRLERLYTIAYCYSVNDNNDGIQKIQKRVIALLGDKNINKLMSEACYENIIVLQQCSNICLHHGNNFHANKFAFKALALLQRCFENEDILEDTFLEIQRQLLESMSEANAARTSGLNGDMGGE